MILNCTTLGCTASFANAKAQSKHNTRYHNTPVKVTSAGNNVLTFFNSIITNYLVDGQNLVVHRAALTELLICPICKVFNIAKREHFISHVELCSGQAMDEDAADTISQVLIAQNEQTADDSPLDAAAAMDISDDVEVSLIAEGKFFIFNQYLC